MKKLVLLVGIVVIGLMGLGITPARAYTIDGLLGDWGVELSNPQALIRGYLNNHLPSGGLDIDYLPTEDNAGSKDESGNDLPSGFYTVGPGSTYRGTFTKNGNTYTDNGNEFDVEAIYFDNDQYNAYIAVVQGLPITGATAPGNPWFLPGDIAIDADNNLSTGEYGFEYGLNILNSHLYSVSDWESVNYFPTSNPWKILSGSDLGGVSFVYSAYQNTHYVLEASIPLNLLGLSGNPGDPIHPLKIHWTQQCGNDYLNLSADVNPVPEPNSLVLLVTGLFGLGFLHTKIGLKL